MVSVIAVVAQRAVEPGTAAGALLLVPVGFVFSYLRRARRNTIFKLGLAGAMFVALWSFIHGVKAAPSVDDARVALAALFLWTQVLHSFDLPRRRDLAFSVVSSLILMAEAGSLSLGSGFALFLFPYLALAGAWLYLSHRLNEEDRAVQAPVLRRTPKATRTKVIPAGARGLVRPFAATTAVVMLAGTVVFLAAPRVKGVRIVAPPFSITRKVAVPGFAGGVVNPGLPSQAGTSSASLNGGYPGFGKAVDLGLRWAERGRPDLAVRAFERAIDIQSRGGMTVPGRTGATERADLYYDYGNALLRLGREAEALTAYERAVREAADDAPAIQALALAYRRAGRSVQADSLERALERTPGGMGMATVNRGWQAAREGRLSEAEQLFRQAAEANPQLSSAWTALIRLQVQSGRLPEARETLDRAKAAGLPQTEADLYEALLAAMAGDAPRAKALLARVPEAALRADPVLADVAAIIRQRTGARAP